MKQKSYTDAVVEINYHTDTPNRCCFMCSNSYYDHAILHCKLIYNLTGVPASVNITGICDRFDKE